MRFLRGNYIFLFIGLAILAIAIAIAITEPSTDLSIKELAERSINVVKAKVDTPRNITNVYLIHSMLAELPDGDIKIVYRIRIHNDYVIVGNERIHMRPIFTDVHGKEMVIPLYNVRAIVKGNNKFKEHLLE